MGRNRAALGPVEVERCTFLSSAWKVCVPVFSALVEEGSPLTDQGSCWVAAVGTDMGIQAEEEGWGRHGE